MQGEESIGEVHRLISQLESLYKGEEAVASLVALGPAAIEPLGQFLLEGKPSKIFQPRLGAVKALAGLGARSVLMAYLFCEKEIADPEERFGEEAVASAAARFLAAWRDEGTYQFLLQISERRLLIGLIDALARFQTPEAIPYFERALEDDFYRPAAEKAFLKVGAVAGDALAKSAMTPAPSASLETPGSLKRRCSAVRLLNSIGISETQWQILRSLLHESDPELTVEASKLALMIASEEDRVLVARRMIDLLGLTPWPLRGDIEEILVKLKHEAVGEIEEEITRRLQKPVEVQSSDVRLRSLLRIKRRWGQASPDTE